jgi:peptidoglycan/xylan/chitin deacetylase (PgdA/CDA1 family)
MKPIGQTWQSLRQDLRTLMQEVAPGSRLPALIRRLLKYTLAAAFHFTGLTGPLLRRALESGHACLILGYHGITEATPGYFSGGHDISNVREQIRFLKRHLRQASLDEIALAISRGEQPPAGTFAVTFDDALVNNVTVAIPMLRKLDVPATFFTPSGLVGSSRDLWVSSLRELVRRWQRPEIPEVDGLWPRLPIVDERSRYEAYFRMKEALKAREDRRQAILDRLASEDGAYARPPEEERVVGPELLRRMTEPPFTVGAHSRTHPILSGLGPVEARAEIAGSRADLEQMLGRPVLDFAYPNGRYPDINDTICRLVAEAGYRCAVTTEPGTVRRGDDRLALRRCLPGNVPAFLASFDLLVRARADRHRKGDLARPLGRRISYLRVAEARMGS